MIEYTLLNVLVLELKLYSDQDKFYEGSKFGQYDEVKNRAPLAFVLKNIAHIFKKMQKGHVIAFYKIIQQTTL